MLLLLLRVADLQAVEDPQLQAEAGQSAAAADAATLSAPAASSAPQPSESEPCGPLHEDLPGSGMSAQHAQPAVWQSAGQAQPTHGSCQQAESAAAAGQAQELPDAASSSGGFAQQRSAAKKARQKQRKQVHPACNLHLRQK